jgi:DNA replication protein DnaC
MENERLSRIIQRFREMRLPMMAEQLIQLIESNEFPTLSPIDLLDRISEAELLSRKSNTVERFRKRARLSQANARLLELHYKPERKLNKSLIQQFQTNDYVQKHRNVILLGATGSGKSYLANALGHHACEGFYTVLYTRMFEIVGDLAHARLMGDTRRGYQRFIQPDVLIIDDFLIYHLNEQEIIDLFKIMEYRHSRNSTIFCSQYDPVEWHRRLGGDPLAESIIDRIVSNSHKMILSGDSLR